MKRKAILKNLLIAIGIFVAVIIIILGMAIQKSAVRERPLGTAQTSILRAGQAGDEALHYLDGAVTLAAREATEQFQEQGGALKDPEGETYPCGKVYDIPYWHNGTQNCIPDFAENLKSVFSGSLVKRLSEHPLYNYPYSFTNTLTTVKDKTKIKGVATQDLTLSFQGGGSSGFEMNAQTFTPDYIGATVPRTLNYASRSSDVQYLLIHYTETRTAETAERSLLENGFSYHYIIDHDGTIRQYVPEDKSAQQPGCSGTTCKQANMNQQSIGISFVNCGYDEQCQGITKHCYDAKGKCWEPYTQEQLDSFVTLVADIATRNEQILKDEKINPETIKMHSDVSTKKSDPGPAFTDQLTTLLDKTNQALREQSISIKEIIEEETPQNKVTGAATLSSTAKEHIAQYEQLIQQSASKHDVPAALIKAMIVKESGGKPESISPTGCVGLLQFCYGTAKGYPQFQGKLTRCCSTDEEGNTRTDTCHINPNCNLDNDNRFDPARNIDAAAEYLSNLYKQYEDYQAQLSLTIASYNAGTRLIKKAASNLPDEGRQATWETIKQQITTELIRETYKSTYFDEETELLRKQNEIKGYVEPILDYYLEFGGDATIITGSEKGTYLGYYRTPLSYEAELPIDLTYLESVATMAREAVNDCHDEPATCLEKHLEAFNNDNDQPLTTNCTDNPLATSFTQQLLGCHEMHMTCNITLPADEYDHVFSIVLDKNGIWETDEERSTLLSDKESNTYLDGEEEKTGQLKYRIYDENGVPMLQVLIDDDEEGDPSRVADATISFINGTKYTTEKTPEGVPAILTEWAVCTQDRSKIRFTLSLEDRKPPQISSLEGRYDETTSIYWIQWAPIHTYDDGINIPDIVAYEVYCSGSNTKITPDDLVLTITHDEGRFDPTRYANIHAITAPLTTCTDDGVEALIVARDHAGQRSEPATITLSHDMTAALPYPSDTQESDHHEFSPEPVIEQPQQPLPVVPGI